MKDKYTKLTELLAQKKEIDNSISSLEKEIASEAKNKTIEIYQKFMEWQKDKGFRFDDISMRIDFKGDLECSFYINKDGITNGCCVCAVNTKKADIHMVLEDGVNTKNIINPPAVPAWNCFREHYNTMQDPFKIFFENWGLK